MANLGPYYDMWEAAIRRAETAEAKVKDLHETLRELDGISCDFGYYEHAAKTMKSIVDKALDGVHKQPQILTNAEQKAQGKRCSCGGADDYCVCQNSLDKTTYFERALKVQP